MTSVAVHDADRDRLIRLGGLGGFLSMAFYVLINHVIKTLPPEAAAPVADLQAYLSQEAGGWALVHGLRYFVFFCFAVFAAGFFSRVRSRSVASADAWSMLGILGTAMLLATGLVTNSIETLVFFDHELLSENPTLFWLLYYVTRFIFTAATLSWGTIVLGFSLAGWRSGTLPRWMIALGVVAAVADISTAVFIVSVLSGGWAAVLPLVAVLSTLAWGTSVGWLMMLRGSG